MVEDECNCQEEGIEGRLKQVRVMLDVGTKDEAEGADDAGRVALAAGPAAGALGTIQRVGVGEAAEGGIIQHREGDEGHHPHPEEVGQFVSGERFRVREVNFLFLIWWVPCLFVLHCQHRLVLLS
jgi:hypothetical protein